MNLSRNATEREVGRVPPAPLLLETLFGSAGAGRERFVLPGEKQPALLHGLL